MIRVELCFIIFTVPSLPIMEHMDHIDYKDHFETVVNPLCQDTHIASIDDELNEFYRIYNTVRNAINIASNDASNDASYETMDIDNFINILNTHNITKSHKYYNHILDEFVYDHLHDFFDESV